MKSKDGDWHLISACLGRARLSKGFQKQYERHHQTARSLSGPCNFPLATDFRRVCEEGSLEWEGPGPVIR